MNFKLAIFSTAALLFAATHAVAGGPPPWAGGHGLSVIFGYGWI